MPAIPIELVLDTGRHRSDATLHLPLGAVVGGVVVLHGAGAPEQDFFLYRHAADALTPLGVAVMTFDRRGLDRHVPLARQADDALVALATLRARLPDVPVGVWGFSQGAWVALMAADRTPSEVAFLVLVGFCAVSPGAQMRHLAGRAVRRAGYGDHDIAAVTELRRSFEAFTRGDLPLEDAQALVDEATVRPWFDLTYIPSQLRTPADPALFDHDPAPGIASLRCPVLLFYGEDDQDVPVEESLRIWREQATAPTTIVSLPGVGHVLTAGEVADAAALPPECATRLGAWVGEQCRRGPTPAPM